MVDDDERKVALIVDLIEGCGVSRPFIFAANDAVTARKSLLEQDFDIVFLDVLLPARLGRQPRGDVSADLLREMYEGGALRHPGTVIGITADLGARGDYRDDFDAFASAILHVELGTDEWKAPLSRMVKAHIARAQAGRLHDYDVCVQTALADPELSEFIKSSGVHWDHEERLFPGVWARFGSIMIGGKNLSVVCASAPAMGMIPATSLAEKLIGRLAPRYLLMTGFCGGIGGELSLGDLVVADKAWDWQSGKYSSDGFVSSVDQKDGCADLLAAARKVAGNLDIMRCIGAAAAHIAPMVSGSSVIADQLMHRRLREQHRKVAAVDMEAYGVYYAANYANPKCSVLCVKGVADLADSAKSDDIQRVCSASSARFAMEVIKIVEAGCG